MATKKTKSVELDDSSAEERLEETLKKIEVTFGKLLLMSVLFQADLLCLTML